MSHNGNAQSAFRMLSSAWRAASPEQRINLEPAYRGFLARYRIANGQTRLASAHLAWILMQKGEPIEANRLNQQAVRGPRGAARDFGTVVEAALLVGFGRPQAALKLLRQVQGKIIDPVERFLATEQLVRAAVAAELYTESLLYIVDWIDQAHVRERERVQRAASAQIGNIPRLRLEQSLIHIETQERDPDLKDNPRRFTVKQWVFDAVSARLSQIALERKDQGLAKKLLEKNPRVAATGPGSEALVRLAAGGALAANITGRTVGLLLSTGNDRDRVRSRQLMTGVSFALGLPQTAELAGSTKLTLVDHDGSGADQALAELLEEGASLLIAGATQADSNAAREFARQHEIPLLLVSPETQSGNHIFNLGVSSYLEFELLLQGSGASSSLWDTLTSSPPNAAGCPSLLGQPLEQVSYVFLRTTHDCAMELQETLAERSPQPWVGFNLEAASAINTSFNRGAFVSTGYYPFFADPAAKNGGLPGDIREGVMAFERNFGHRPTWYEALGHDAGRLADHALASVPELVTNDTEQVRQFHSDVETALRNADLRGLWTATSGRFTSELQVKRELRLKRSTP